jgi:hypothetical protein
MAAIADLQSDITVLDPVRHIKAAIAIKNTVLPRVSMTPNPAWNRLPVIFYHQLQR